MNYLIKLYRVIFTEFQLFLLYTYGQKLENILDIFVVRNANTQKQENELVAIIKKQNSAGWNLISKSTAIVDTKN